MNKYTVNNLKRYFNSKYYEQNKPASELDFIKRSEPIKRSEIDVKEGTINHYELEKTYGVIDDKCIECKSKSDKNASIEPYLEKIRLHLRNMMDSLKDSCQRNII